VIGQGDIDGIHPTLQAFLELVVGETALDLIAAAELFQLLRVIGNQGRDFRVLCVGKGR
jgi:hypothetical protein